MKCIKQIIQQHNLTVDWRKVRLARVEKGWTITKLSQESGVTRKTIGQIESGSKKRIRFSTIYQIANTLGKPVENFCIEVKRKVEGGNLDEF